MSRKGETVYFWRECTSDTQKIHVKKGHGANPGKRKLPSKELLDRLAESDEKISLEELNLLCFGSEKDVTKFFESIRGRVLSPKFGVKRSTEVKSVKVSTSNPGIPTASKNANGASLNQTSKVLKKCREDDEVIGGTLETWEKSRGDKDSKKIDDLSPEFEESRAYTSGLVLKKQGEEYKLVEVSTIPEGYRILRDDDFIAAEQGKYKTRRLLNKVFRTQEEFMKIRSAMKRSVQSSTDISGTEK